MRGELLYPSWRMVVSAVALSSASIPAPLIGALSVTTEDSPSQLFPKAVDVLEPDRLQRREVLVQGSRKGLPGRSRWCPLPHERREIFGRDAFAVASRGRHPVVPLAERGGRGIDPGRGQEGGARPPGGA